MRDERLRAEDRVERVLRDDDLRLELRAGDRRDEVLRGEVLRGDVLRDDVLRAGDLRDDDFLDRELDVLDEERLDGTLPPALLASESAMAIACLRLVTFLPERPLRKVPLFRSCIAFLTLLCAVAPYLAIMLLLRS